MTLELLHGIRDYTLTRTSIPNHAGNIKDMKYNEYTAFMIYQIQVKYLDFVKNILH